MLKRVIHFLRRTWYQPRDRNFKSFPKYRTQGAYHWVALKNDPEYRGHVEFICGLAHPMERCLDLGCGDAACVGALGGRGHEVVGCDADFDAIELAKRELARRNLSRCSVIHAPLSQLLAEHQHAESFDLVYSMDVIEHLPQPAELLQVAVKTCRQGGRICVGTPVFITPELVSPFHVREFSAEEFRALLLEWLDDLELKFMPTRRKNGVVYEQGYMYGIGRPRALPRAAGR